MCKRLPVALVAAIGVALLAPAHRLAASPPATEGLDPVANGITVLTYNTHLFKDSSAEVGKSLKEDWEDVWGLGEYNPRRTPILFDDNNRAKLIVARVKRSGAHIVALQEVWALARQKWFSRQLADAYRHRYYPPDEVLDPRTTSGLVLLSKYRLRNLEFSAFPGAKRGEFWAQKGVITATVEPWPSGPTFRLGIGHALKDMGGKKLPNIRDIASKTTTGHAGPAIMMGDFNVHQLDPGRKDEYGSYT